MAAPRLVSDINSVPIGSYPTEIISVVDTLFFSATDGSSGPELWEIDLATELPKLAISRDRARKTEGISGKTIYSFDITRTGDRSSNSSATWSISGSGNNPTDADDFIGGVLPSGSIRFRTGQSTRMIKIRVRGDQIQEFDKKFSITLDNPTGATIAAAKATGVIRNDDLIGTPDNDTIAGSRRADFINGLAGQDNLTGRGGPDRFGFRFGQSRIHTPGRITDFRFGKDSISLVNQRGRLQPIPQALFRAANNSTAATFRELANAVFADADGLTRGNQGLAAKSAALVKSTNAEITGTYLFINNGKAGLNLRGDLFIDITGFTGSIPDFDIQQVESMFTSAINGVALIKALPNNSY